MLLIWMINCQQTNDCKHCCTKGKLIVLCYILTMPTVKITSNPHWQKSITTICFKANLLHQQNKQAKKQIKNRKKTLFDNFSLRQIIRPITTLKILDPEKQWLVQKVYHFYEQHWTPYRYAVILRQQTHNILTRDSYSEKEKEGRQSDRDRDIQETKNFTVTKLNQNAWTNQYKRGHI